MQRLRDATLSKTKAAQGRNEFTVHLSLSFALISDYGVRRQSACNKKRERRIPNLVVNQHLRNSLE
jgi:hypothetical protein